MVYEHVFCSLELLSQYEYKFMSAYGKDSMCNAEYVARQFLVPHVMIFDFDVFTERGKREKMMLERLDVIKGSPNLLKEIENFSAKIIGTKDIKKKGINAINDSKLKEEGLDLMEKLKIELGIFIVPHGDLESWHEIASFKSHYPEKFKLAYKKKGQKFKNINRFLMDIEKYLKNNL